MWVSGMSPIGSSWRTNAMKSIIDLWYYIIILHLMYVLGGPSELLSSTALHPYWMHPVYDGEQESRECLYIVIRKAVFPCSRIRPCILCYIALSLAHVSGSASISWPRSHFLSPPIMGIIHHLNSIKHPLKRVDSLRDPFTRLADMA